MSARQPRSRRWSYRRLGRGWLGRSRLGLGRLRFGRLRFGEFRRPRTRHRRLLSRHLHARRRQRVGIVRGIRGLRSFVHVGSLGRGYAIGVHNATRIGRVPYSAERSLRFDPPLPGNELGPLTVQRYAWTRQRSPNTTPNTPGCCRAFAATANLGSSSPPMELASITLAASARRAR